MIYTIQINWNGKHALGRIIDIKNQIHRGGNDEQIIRHTVVCLPKPIFIRRHHAHCCTCVELHCTKAGINLLGSSSDPHFIQEFTVCTGIFCIKIGEIL